MWPIMKRMPDAECFSRQLDLKEVSCLGGHLRGPEWQRKYVAHMPLLPAAAPRADITNQSQPFPLEARESFTVLPAWGSRQPLPMIWNQHAG